ncbi:MAG: TonB-dependent receptor, partial [Verrucomicrobiota bacterium]
VVVKPLNWLSLYVNKADSFQPTTPSQNLLRKELPNPTGEGVDYGFALNLFDGKLIVRANQYETKQKNSPYGQSGTFAQRILSADFVEFNNGSGPRLNEAARAWTIAAAAQRGEMLTESQIQTEVFRTLQLTPQDFEEFRALPITDVADIVGKGKEIELNFNPVNYWTIKLNVTQQIAINSNLSPALLAWAEKRLPVWQTVRNPVTGALWWTTNFSSAQTVETFYRDSVLAPIRLEQATDGQARPQVRKYRVNVSSNFRLSGITDNKWMKRFNVGGAMRWEDKGAIGYYGVQQLPATITELDPTRPIWDKSHLYVDAFIGYRTRLFADKVGARFQLNVRNLGEDGRLQPVGAYPDGTMHSFRIIDPQQFIFSVTFDL